MSKNKTKTEELRLHGNGNLFIIRKIKDTIESDNGHWTGITSIEIEMTDKNKNKIVMNLGFNQIVKLVKFLKTPIL